MNGHFKAYCHPHTDIPFKVQGQRSQQAGTVNYCVPKLCSVCANSEKLFRYTGENQKFHISRRRTGDFDAPDQVRQP